LYIVNIVVMYAAHRLQK